MSGDIYAALAAIQGEVGVVGKTRQNPQQGYKFRGIDDVMAHVQALQAQHGVICVPRVVEREREMVPTKSGGTMASVRLVIDHHFYAKDGSSVVCTTLGEAMDSGDKASNKAMSAALKYALVETYMIPTYEADRDTEEQSPVMAGALGTKPKAAPVKAAPVAGKAGTESVASPAPDDLEREKAALRAAFAAASNVTALDVLWTRVKALPTVDVAELTVDFKARKTALRGVAA
jgi:hypothetical protein